MPTRTQQIYHVRPFKLEDPTVLQYLYRILPSGNGWVAAKQNLLTSDEGIVYARHWHRVSAQYSRKGNVERIIQNLLKNGAPA